MKYAPIEGEALALVWAVERLSYLLEGHRTLVRCDHKPLMYIFKNEGGKSKLTRWALLLQQYDLEVEYVAGKANVLADYNSRVPISTMGGVTGDDAFDIAQLVPPTSSVFAALEEWNQ